MEDEDRREFSTLAAFAVYALVLTLLILKFIFN